MNGLAGQSTSNSTAPADAPPADAGHVNGTAARGPQAPADNLTISVAIATAKTYIPDDGNLDMAVRGLAITLRCNPSFTLDRANKVAIGFAQIARAARRNYSDAQALAAVKGVYDPAPHVAPGDTSNTPLRMETPAKHVDLGDFLTREVYPRLSAEQIYTALEHNFQKAGDKWRGGCTHHESKSGTSFVVTPSSLLWFCAGCGVGGGPIQYLHRMQGGTGSPKGQVFIGWVKELADRAGVAFPERQLTPEQQERSRQRETRRAILEVVILRAESLLMSPASEQARAYLSSRGFGPDDIADLRIGFYDSATEMQKALMARGFTSADIAESRAAWAGMEGYVVFPWNDESTRPLTLYGKWPAKILPAGKPKTTALPNPTDNGDTLEHTKRSAMYFDRVRKGGHAEAIVVEGVTDAALGQRRGDTRVCACVGAQLSKLQAETFARCGVKSVTIALDPDTAGDNGIDSCVRSLLAVNIAPFVAPRLPDGMDPDDFIITHGIGAWREHIAGAVHGLRHKARRIAETNKPASGWTDKALAATTGDALKFAATVPACWASDLDNYFWAELEKLTGLKRPAAGSQEQVATAEAPAAEKNTAVEVYHFEPFGIDELIARAKPPEWSVQGISVMGQPGIFGGPRKALKTSIGIAYCIAVATGRPFLGKFVVPRPRRVCFVSGESGEFVILDIVRRVCASMGLVYDDIRTNMSFHFRLPQLANRLQLREMARGLKARGAEQAVIDPLYLCLLAGISEGGPQASNLFEMGPLYRDVAETCLDAGCTPWLSHHFRSTRADHTAQPDLSDLSFAGVQEFAAQWLLLGRREPFRPGSGEHRLWMVAGGRVGHSGCWGVDVAEGQLDGSFGGRTWEAKVMTESEAIAAKQEQAADKRNDKQLAKEKADDADFLLKLDELDPNRQGVTRGAIRGAVGWSYPRINGTVDRLLDGGFIEQVSLKMVVGNGAKRDCEVIRRRNLGEHV